LLAFWGLSLNTAGYNTLTVDEPVHITRSIALWQGLDYRLQQEHTPLAHWLIGMLVHTEPLPRLSTLPGWHDGDRLVVTRTLLQLLSADLTLTRFSSLARVPLIWLGVVLGAFLMRWVRAFAPRQPCKKRLAQLTAGGLFAFSPNLIAHTAVATTDLAVTAGYCIALFTLYQYVQQPTPSRWLLAGSGLGLGLASKITGLLLLPITLLLIVVASWQQTAGDRTSLSQAVGRWLALLPPAALVVWGLYRFQVGPLFVPQLGQVLTLPAPDYWDSLLRVTHHIDEGHQAFLMGAVSTSGWYHYFGVALAVKTAIPVLLLLLVALTQGWQQWQRQVWLWLPAAILFGVASYSRLNIGYRHILPILPLLIVWGTAGITGWINKLPRYSSARRWLLVGVAGLLGWQIGAGWRQHPHHLAYFNELSGGSAHGYRYLLDSNLDWGQDMNLVVDFLAENQDGQVFVAPFGFYHASFVPFDQPRLLDESGHNSGLLSPANPTAGHYLISSNYLPGLLPEPDLFDWFRRQSPVAQLGYTLFVYEVVEQDRGSWIAHCADPEPRLDPAAAEQVVNASQIRHLYFDCQQSWVWPQAGEAGWYILPAGEAWWMAELFPDVLRVVYEHQATAAAPAYTVYYWTGELDPSARLAGERVVSVADTALLLGHHVEANTWYTVWQITATTDLPLSVLAHLYANRDDPAPLAVADGLGFTAAQWRSGDLLVQAHAFDISGSHLQTGLYNYLTGERLTLNNGAETAVWLLSGQ
jgi:hypothetical protein